MITDVVGHYLGFAAFHVHEETLESVQIPYFGTFKPRMDVISAKEHVKGLPPIKRGYFKKDG